MTIVNDGLYTLYLCEISAVRLL